MSPERIFLGSRIVEQSGPNPSEISPCKVALRPGTAGQTPNPAFKKHSFMFVFFKALTYTTPMRVQLISDCQQLREPPAKTLDTELVWTPGARTRPVRSLYGATGRIQRTVPKLALRLVPLFPSTPSPQEHPEYPTESRGPDVPDTSPRPPSALCTRHPNTKRR